MSNPSDQDHLLNDLLGEDFRTESLAHTLAAVRAARRMRSVRSRIGRTAPLLLAAAVLLHLARQPQTVAPIAAQPAPLESSIRMITEDELLAQFPGRAVGIVGPPERRQLVFLDRR